MSEREQQPPQTTADQAASLRRSFDDAFAEARTRAEDRSVDLLIVQIAGHAHALRTSEIAAIVGGARIVPTPSPMRELLGIAGVRGQLVAVYDLSLLLGLPHDERRRWLVLAAKRPDIAFSLGELVGQLRVESHDVQPLEAHATNAETLSRTGVHKHVVRTPSGVLPLIEIASIVEAVTTSARAHAPREEQGP